MVFLRVSSIFPVDKKGWPIHSYSQKTALAPKKHTTLFFSKRPPRRAAIRARETVNFLHGNVENGLELRGTRKALEKADMSDDEHSDEEKMVQDSSFLSNSDLFDADSGGPHFDFLLHITDELELNCRVFLKMSCCLKGIPMER